MVIRGEIEDSEYAMIFLRDITKAKKENIKQRKMASENAHMEQFLVNYKTMEPLETLDVLLSPENICKNLTSENDIYKFEYCSKNEDIYKIASFVPLE